MSQDKTMQSIPTDAHELDYRSDMMCLILRKSGATFANKKPEAFEAAALLKNAETLMRSLNPQNGVQAMLAAQMLAVHELQQHQTCSAKQAQHPQLRSQFVKDVVKLANVFLRQLQTLEKMQGKEDQKIIVEHVNVHPGAQAVVGSVIHSHGKD
jgi:hypothetical protein